MRLGKTLGSSVLISTTFVGLVSQYQLIDLLADCMHHTRSLQKCLFVAGADSTNRSAS